MISIIEADLLAGVYLFLVLLGLVGWVIFWDYTARVPTSVIITVLAVATTFRVAQLDHKWKEFFEGKD